jgi:hypothetical protein
MKRQFRARQARGQGAGRAAWVNFMTIVQGLIDLNLSSPAHP